jgi:hypothetical protein
MHFCKTQQECFLLAKSNKLSNKNCIIKLFFGYGNKFTYLIII